MKYFLTEISFLNDDTTAQAVYALDDATNAEMRYHQTLASAMANPNVKSMLCFIMDENGYTLRQEKWNREVPNEEE